MKTHIRLSKKLVLEKFGGVEAAAAACALTSVQAVYAWPELLSIRQSLMCHGALCLLAAPVSSHAAPPPRRLRPSARRDASSRRAK